MKQNSVIALIFMLFLSCLNKSSQVKKLEPKVIFPDGFVVDVKLAISDFEKGYGLMFVSSLPEDNGMLFINDEESKNPFWMKNCLIPLDLIWLGKDGEIVDITRNAEPCNEDPCPNYYPSKSYFYVLEVNGNLSLKHNLKIGDRIMFVDVFESVNKKS